MTNLKSLLLNDNVTEIDWSQLSDVQLNNVQLTNFAAENSFFYDLAHLSNSASTLTSLKISNTEVLDISSLSSFTALTDLYVNLVETESPTATNQTLIDLGLNGVNIYEAPDIDGNGVFDYLELDGDGDYVPDYYDPFPSDATEWLDTDNDGVGNNADNDDDGDGVLDVIDAFPLDATETLDTDGDGVGDNSDAFIDDSSEWLDTDEDGIGDNADTDDDNDGTADINDDYPLDPTIQTTDDLSGVVEFTKNDTEDRIVSLGAPKSDALWFEQFNDFISGDSALRSGSVEYGQESVLTAEVSTGIYDGELTFDWKVSSNGELDFLELYLDGSWVTSISGEQDWINYSLYLPAGSHTIEWIYYKGGSDPQGQDAGWVDNVQIVIYENGAP